MNISTDVTAIIPTRGDVPLDPILESLPLSWELLVWDNSGKLFSGAPEWRRYFPGLPGSDRRVGVVTGAATDLSVYGRYAAIGHASHDLIYVQDDDVIVSDPQAIVTRWWDARAVAADGCLYVPHMEEIARGEHLAANMPPEFRHDGYTDSCLVGFGACFHRNAPKRAFDKFMASDHWEVIRGMDLTDVLMQIKGDRSSVLERTCDVVFTTLTPRVLVDVPKENTVYASNATRMYRQQGHLDERSRMLKLARQVRDS